VFAIPGLTLLVLFDYFKPQEYVPILAGLPLLHVFTGLALLGFLVDLRVGVSRLTPSPQLALTLAFVAWSVLATAPRGSRVLVSEAYGLLVPISLFLLVGHAVQTFRALHAMMALVLAIGLAIAFVGTHQGFAPWSCHRVDYASGERTAVSDGRPCADLDASVCYVGDAEPGAVYVCERHGLLETQTVQGRVRFRGTMKDPNELSLAVAILMPLAFGFYDRRRSARTGLLLLATIAIAAACAVLTQSRGGQLVFVVVLGVYFVNRFGARGLALGAVAALPVLLLGGRDTAEAAGSTLERIECWAAGLRMLRSSPLLGVGLGQFTEHHYLTAHSSYVLTAAELGLPGAILWSSIVWLSLKIPLRALRVARSPEGAALPRLVLPWALALVAAMTGLATGMVFLSYAYKEVLWIHVGLSAGLYQAIRRHHPGFHVRFGVRDLALVAAANGLLLVGTSIFTRLKLGY
jgi:O-antigen ligase